MPPTDQTPRAAVGGRDDTALVTAALARGDEEAFAVFYAAWFPRVVAAARRRTGRDESTCLDIAQDVMLKVVRRIRPMRTRDDLDRWMARVIDTTAADHLRRDRRRARRERAARPEWPAPPPSALTEERAWLDRRVADLSPEERGLLLTRVGHGRTLEQSGRAAGLTGGAAHGRIRRLLASLRAAALADPASGSRPAAASRPAAGIRPPEERPTDEHA